jgi:GTPase SAR1 family protein
MNNKKYLNFKKNKHYNEIDPVFPGNEEKLSRCIFILGQQNSGKSFLISMLIKHFHFKEVIKVKKEKQSLFKRNV